MTFFWFLEIPKAWSRVWKGFRIQRGEKWERWIRKENSSRLMDFLSNRPLFSTVDLSYKIMNHTTPNDFIELPFRVDLKLKGRLLPSVTLKNFYCIVLLILHSPLGLFLRNWNTWLLTEITNSNTLFSETRASEMREVGTGNFPF